MKIRKQFLKLPPLVLFCALILLPAALAYLLFAHRYGFYYDDWYLIFAGHSQGIQKFVDVFASDRPARAFLVGAQYTLFGDNAPAYSYSAYLLRVAAAFAFYWILRRVWPHERFLSLIAPLLFVLYPGFLDQTNAFDFQSHLVSLTLAMFSIAFTLESIATTHRAARIVFSALSLLFTLAYLPLMEYYIGLEGLRFLLVWQTVASGAPGTLFKKTRKAVWMSLPAFLGAAGFFIWRLFFFSSERGATDINAMFSGLAGSSLRGLWMLVHLVQDVISTVFLAWAVPAYQMAYSMRLRDFLLGFAVAAVGIALILWIVTELSHSGDHDELYEPDRWTTPVLWIGLLAVVCALIPVALGDRHVAFPSYNRFTLPAAPGACLMMVAFLFRIKAGRWRKGALGLLCGLALLTHFGNAASAVDQANNLRDFWWQVAWRAPGIQEGTTLVVDYASTSVVEDYIAWGPANLIYYPQATAPYTGPEAEDSDVPLTQTPLNAIVPSSSADIQAVQLGSAGKRERRGFLSLIEYGDSLILSQPSASACVHILDGQTPELSADEALNVQAIAGQSKINRVITGGESPTPSTAIFGAEPEHKWCYYYQKASLARQRADWTEAARQGDEASANGFHPVDRVEWFPILQAYAYTGQMDKARAILPIINEVPYLKAEACKLFSSPNLAGAKEHADAQQFLTESFCQ
jgi:hypothetical protein